jgi:hypothetical protein
MALIKYILYANSLQIIGSLLGRIKVKIKVKQGQS